MAIQARKRRPKGKKDKTTHHRSLCTNHYIFSSELPMVAVAYVTSHIQLSLIKKDLQLLCHSCCSGSARCIQSSVVVQRAAEGPVEPTTALRNRKRDSEKEEEELCPPFFHFHGGREEQKRTRQPSGLGIVGQHGIGDEKSETLNKERQIHS
ncbi:hypothetical protein Baya_0270 [Bagarius yarrelli]|uniref:Uncharacterized protein n=1 Tax=Bagarius yarrelli TaxID=175774 RepID=A0A556THS8_BAGYA|nr:hypothetical protein Baya_0270 [Bagarius yarrelli]